MYGPKRQRPSPPRRLSTDERADVLDVLHEPRFIDLAPAEVYATLLDEGRRLCSVRTMHRVLAENTEAGERRNQLRHPNYTPPELLATAPNQLWSWDITKLLGPAKWTYYYLYVIIDVFSRYVVGWMVAHRESAALAQKLIAETCRRQGIAKGQLTLHADRGSSIDLEASCVPACRHGCHQNAFAAARLGRQPVQRGELQNAKVQARLPRPLRRKPLSRESPTRAQRASSPRRATSRHDCTAPVRPQS